jgi:hypothetical protein
MNGLSDEEICEVNEANVILEALHRKREAAGIAGRDALAARLGKMTREELKKWALRNDNNGDEEICEHGNEPALEEFDE